MGSMHATRFAKLWCVAILSLVGCGARTGLEGSSSAVEPDGGAGSSDGGASFGDGGLTGEAGRSPDAGICLGIPPGPKGGGPGTPAVLAQVPQGASIALDADNLYVASFLQGPVTKVPLDGSPATPLDTVGQYNVAVNDSTVFTLDILGIIAACPKAGCGGQYDALVRGQLGAWGLAADETNLYWTNQGTSTPSTPALGVMAIPIAGGAPVSLYGDGAATSIATRSGRVFFVAYAGAPGDFGGESLRAMGADGRDPQVLVSGNNLQITAITVDCVAVYYQVAEGGLLGSSVWSVPLGGGSPSRLATTGSPGFQIAVDAADVYFVTTTHAAPGDTTSLIQSIPLTGGPVTTLASTASAPGGLAVDATNVYWADPAAGTVMKLAK
jgi:hypothetical protein